MCAISIAYYVCKTSYVFQVVDVKMASSVSNRVKNILVLGAGLTGASIAASIRYSGLNVDIWEKSKGIGKLRLCF